jgi:hypothetical protein
MSRKSITNAKRDVERAKTVRKAEKLAREGRPGAGPRQAGQPPNPPPKG